MIGSYYEVHCTKEYDFPFHKSSTFTDDSLMTAAVCRAILNNPADITKFGLLRRAREYAALYRQYYSYFPDAGFGNMFAEWAKSPHPKRGHSYANGAAMRVCPIGYAYSTLEQTLLQAKASCLPTHDHPEAIAGAQAVAAAVFMARQNAGKDEIRDFLQRRFKYDLSVPLEDIRATHVFNSRSSYSVPPAIIAFLASHDYESAVRNAVSLGGDADTQGCIAGGIAEAFYKTVPPHIKQFCDRRIDISVKAAVRAFCERYPAERKETSTG